MKNLSRVSVFLFFIIAINSCQSEQSKNSNTDKTTNPPIENTEKEKKPRVEPVEPLDPPKLEEVTSEDNNTNPESSGNKIEEGLASYYADQLHGNPVASGEKYNKDELTAAHRTLPFNTMVKVTNLENMKSVVVRINDRGPHVQKRIIDISGAAAIEIDMVRSGIVKCRVETVETSEL